MKRWLESLRAVVPASIAARGAVCLLLAVLAVAVPGYMAYRLADAHTRAQREYESEAFLAAALAAQLEQGTEPTDENREWLEQLTARGMRVHWAGLLKADGTGIEFRRPGSIPRDEILPQVDVNQNTRTQQALEVGGRTSRRFELITVPLPLEGVVLAAVLDRGEPTTNGQPTAAAVVGLACVAFVGLLLAWLWFQRAIARPIDMIREQVAAMHTGLSAASVGDGLPSELAGLAASASELQRELQRWRGEAEHWRRSVETAVEGRTRHASQAQRRAEREAGTDPLTRLGNRRLFERELPRLFEVQQRAGGELSLVVIDVDRFKALNDTCGHPAGDRLLAFVGDLIRASTRKGTDLAVRYGGDEFVLALVGTTAAEACEVAERLAKLFAQRVRTLAALNPPPSLSVGVAGLRQDRAQSWEDLVRLADEAMYWAKRQHCGVATVRAARAGGSRGESGMGR